MMEQFSQRLFRHINLVYALVILLGCGLSLIVYYSGKQIDQATHKLVQHDVQSYAVFQQLRNELSEQERNLYEYYASFERTYFQLAFKENQSNIEQIVSSLEHEFGQLPPLKNIRASQNQVISLATALDENLLKRNSAQTDWDLARQQLSEISETRRAIHPFINQLTAITSSNIEESRQDVTDYMNRVYFIVVLYSLASLIIALVVVRALKAYIQSAARNQRLSLFPKRTPNPIISLDAHNNITYSNPATKRLLKKLGAQPEQAELLISGELEEQQKLIKLRNINFNMFEFVFAGATLQCELHRLSDQNQWDLHITDVTAQKNLENKLHFQAYHHPETGLENQYKFRETLSLACASADNFSLGLIEIRSYNRMLASLSFEKTQQVVGAISAILNKTCHDFGADIELYHIGDKHFAVRIPGGKCKETTSALVKLLNTNTRDSEHINGHKIQLDFGFACFPTDAEDTERLINNARIALNASASDEHSDFMMFDEKIGNEIKRQGELLQSMQHTLSQDGFQLYFQPQFSIRQNKIIGAEVLLRWHKQQQWISPSEFIPIAEQSGLIIPLGEWVLNKACLKAKEIHDQGYSDLVFAVNISPKQFSGPDFVSSVARALHHSGLAAKNLELEITEGVIFNNEKTTIENLRQLKAMGVKLAIDDFGTGYSSLNYLKQFPIDKLKIDQSFVRQMHTDDADQSIVRTIINLGNNLNLTLIAEGVEEEVQLNLLRNMGCDEIQGYWYSKPLDDGYFRYFLQSDKAEVC